MLCLPLTLAALITISCARPQNPLKDVLPVQVQRTWTLHETRNLTNEDAPKIISGQGLKRSLLAVYRGNGSIQVRIYEMGAEASAFELIQKWRQADGAAFYKGRYFVVADSGDVDRDTLSSFLQALQHDLKT
jgi:hypothetical protein